MQYLLFTCFLFILSYCVYCYAPKHQDKFLVYVNLLVNKPDSDSSCPTCSTESHKGLGVFPEDLLGGRVDLQLGQEVLDEVVRRD